MQSLFCCSAATSSLCDLTTRRIKMRGVTLFKRLFGRPKFKSSGRISIKLSRLPKDDAAVIAESIPFVTKGGLSQSGRRAPHPSDRSKVRRLKKGSARPNPRRRSWSLLKKFNVKQNQHELTPPKTLKRHASMYSISSPLDPRPITHYTAGQRMHLMSSPSTLELFEPGRQPVRREIIPPIKKSTSLARISTYNPSSMTLCEAATISSQWLHQEELRASSEDLKLASKLESIVPDDRAPSRLGPLPSHETRPSTSRSRRTKASSRPSTAGSVSSTLFEVEMGPPAIKFEDIKITPPKRQRALSFSEARPSSRRGPVQELPSLPTESASPSALREAVVSTPVTIKGNARVPPKRKPVPSLPLFDIVIPPPSSTDPEFLDQESRATSPMARRKPVPYHILDDLKFSEIPSAWAQSQSKLVQ